MGRCQILADTHLGMIRYERASGTILREEEAWYKQAMQPDQPQKAKRDRRRRCLVIEDNEDSAESMGLLLQLDGHEVVLARDGAEGIARAWEIRPDVVLCDIGLPGGLDGYGVARALRAEPELAGTFLIALTGYGQAEDRRRSHEAGFDIHLTKPADPGMLRQLIAGRP